MLNTIAELVFIPAFGIGHIMSTVETAKLLVNRDPRLSITLLLIKPPSAFGSDSAITTYFRSLTNNANAMDRIRFVHLPQHQIPPNHGPEAPMTFLIDFINSHCQDVRNAVADMMNQPGFGQVAGFVVDLFCIGMIDVANEFHVPTYLFYTASAASLGFNLYMHTLCLCLGQNQDVTEFTKSDAEFPVPSFVNPVPAKIFPTVTHTKEGLHFIRYFAQKMKEVKAIMANTFLELETHAIQSLLSIDNSLPVYPVGPVLNLEGAAGKPQDGEVMRWLDGQAPSSVVFLCFGSMGNFEEIQVKEIAHALERSGHRFVWSLRRPPQTMKFDDYEDVGTLLPEGFLGRTGGVGKMMGWAPQTAVLAHPAIGGFVSHCGWNSVLESLWFGVPLATWPMYAEQQLNAFELVVELGVAVEISLDYSKNVYNPMSEKVVMVTAEEIESGIRQLMENMDVRAKVKEMSRKSRAAVVTGGSSFTSIGHLIHEFISNIS